MFWEKNNAVSAANDTVHTDKAVKVIIYSSENEYISELQYFIKEAAEKAGFEVKVHDAKNSELLQLDQVKRAQERGDESIIVNLVSSYSAPQILEAAGNMKMVMVTFPPANMNILNRNAIYVGSEDAAAGIMQGEWLSNYYKERGITRIRYILLQGPLKLTSTTKRTDAVLQTLSQNGILAIPAAPSIDASYIRREAMSKMLSILRSGVMFDTIISNNDSMALGAIEAMEYLNMDPSKKVIVGVDAIEPALQAILEGKMAMTVFQNAKAQGSAAVKALINMLNGNPISQGTGYQVAKDNPYVIWIPFELVTRQHIPKDLYF